MIDNLHYLFHCIHREGYNLIGTQTRFDPDPSGRDPARAGICQLKFYLDIILYKILIFSKYELIHFN